MNNVVNSPKTDTFKFRINPEVRKTAEEIFESCGLTMTQAINLFLQQSINAGGLPFAVKAQSDEEMRSKAIEILKEKLEAAEKSGEYIPAEEVYKSLGIEI